MSIAVWTWKRKLVLTTLVTFGVLAAGEIALRAWDYFFRLPYRTFDRQLGIVRLVPGYNGVVDGGILRVNSRGTRGPEFSLQTPPGVYRIVMLGDSVTFGFSGDDCDYPGVLQALFDAGRVHRVEVINGAVEGYNSQDVLRVLEGDLLRYAPNLVTVLVGWNDLVKQDPGRPTASRTQVKMAYLLYDVYLIKLWRKAFYGILRPLVLRPSLALSSAEEDSLRDYIPVVYKENLRRIVSAAQKAGSDVILFTRPSLLRDGMSRADVAKLFFPYFTYNLRKYLVLHERYNETVQAIGSEMGVQVIDLQPAVQGHESDWFTDTAHLQCEGSQALAAYLHDRLAARVKSDGAITKVGGR
jgi:lysophospholipase L1-like esterase